MTPYDERPTPAPEGAAPPAPRLTCRDVIGLLLEYLETTLSPDVVAEFERHLQDCAPCRAYLRTYERTRRLAGEVGRVEMPDDLKDRLRTLLLGRLRSGQP